MKMSLIRTVLETVWRRLVSVRVPALRHFSGEHQDQYSRAFRKAEVYKSHRFVTRNSDDQTKLALEGADPGGQNGNLW